MNKRFWLAVGTGLWVVSWLTGCGAPAQRTGGSAEETVDAFYAWYSAIEGSPVGGGAYHDCEYLSADYIDKIDALVASFRESGGGYDPFICAQDRPTEIKVIGSDGTPELTRVTVEAWHSIYVDVTLTDQEWQIVDIHCSMPEASAG